MDLKGFGKKLGRVLLARLGIRRRMPISFVQIELSSHCNYKCPGCPQSQWREPQFSEVPFDRPKGFMTFDLFQRVVDQSNEIAREINFSFFGEPTMHPEFLKFMDYLKNRNPELRVVMNTNLSYATREILQKLIEIDLTELRLSIDASTAMTYDVVRPGKYYVDLDGKPKPGNRFDTICHKAEYWLSLPDHRPTKHVFTVSSRNKAEIKDFVQRWLPLLGERDVILTKSILTYGGKISDELIRAHPCNVWQSSGLTVAWDGRVTPCNLDTNMDLTIGSAHESDLLDLHRGPKREQIRTLSEKRDLVPCKTCVDANNWSRNIVFRRGDTWKDEYYAVYEDERLS